MKNLTLARIRTQVPCFSSKDALSTKPRVPVAESEFFFQYAFRSYTYSVAFHSCGLFSTCCYLVFFIICPLLITLYNIALLIIFFLYSSYYIIYRFESKLELRYATPCRNWTFQRYARAAQRKGRN